MIVRSFNELYWTRRISNWLQNSGLFVAVGREKVLWDRTRADIATDSSVFEVDWAPKWAEAIGQASWYAAVTRKSPGVVLLVSDFRKEAPFLYRTSVVCAKNDFKLWFVDCKKAVIDINGEKNELPELQHAAWLYSAAVLSQETEKRG